MHSKLILIFREDSMNRFCMHCRRVVEELVIWSEVGYLVWELNLRSTNPCLSLDGLPGPQTKPKSRPFLELVSRPKSIYSEKSTTTIDTCTIYGKGFGRGSHNPPECSLLNKIALITHLSSYFITLQLLSNLIKCCLAKIGRAHVWTPVTS